MRKKRTTSPYVVRRKSGIHNYGIFARTDIPKGTRVIEYTGDKITKKESDRRAEETLEKNAKDSSHGAVYIFTLNKKYDIDGDVWWNTAKYINHSCDPNCETDIIKGKIWIIAIRDIKLGEEITYNYGYDIDNYEDHECLCGADNCIGYILAEEYWPKFRRKLKRQAKKEEEPHRKGNLVYT